MHGHLTRAPLFHVIDLDLIWQLIDHKPNCFGAWLDCSHNPLKEVKKDTFAAREEHGAVADTTPLIDVLKKVARNMVKVQLFVM